MIKKIIIISFFLLAIVQANEIDFNQKEDYDIDNLIDINLNNISRTDYINYNLENIIKNSFLDNIQYQQMKVKIKPVECIKNECNIKDLKIKTLSGNEYMNSIKILFNENSNDIKNIDFNNIENDYEKTKLYKINNYYQFINFSSDIVNNKIKDNYKFKFIMESIQTKKEKDIIFPVNLLRTLPEYSQTKIYNYLKIIYMNDSKNHLIYNFDIKKDGISTFNIDLDMELFKVKFNMTVKQSKIKPLKSYPFPITGKINYYIDKININIDISNFIKFINSDDKLKNEIKEWQKKEKQIYKKIYNKKSYWKNIKNKNKKIWELYFDNFINIKMFKQEKLNIYMKFKKERHPIAFYTYYRVFRNGNVELINNTESVFDLTFDNK